MTDYEFVTTWRVKAPQAIGELQGTAAGNSRTTDEITTVRYDWKVETTKAWMNLLAPIARPFFSWKSQPRDGLGW
ncbi:MAG: hypothetical protein ABJC10_06260 [Acidobacteriota bacterium]